MDIFLKENQEQPYCKLYHDIDGNYMLNIGDNMYAITIDNDLNLICYKICNDDNDNDNNGVIIFNKFAEETDEKFVETKQLLEMHDDDITEQEKNKKISLTYCPDDIYLNHQNDDDDENDEKMYYYSDDTFNLLCKNVSLGGLSEYDTYIYKNSRPIYSCVCGNGHMNSYRLYVYNDSRNIFELNCVGDCIKRFELTFVENTPVFKFFSRKQLLF